MISFDLKISWKDKGHVKIINRYIGQKRQIISAKRKICVWNLAGQLFKMDFIKGGKKLKTEPSMTKSNRDKKYSVILWYRIFRIYKNNTTETNKILKKWDISNAQFEVISRIAAAGTLSQQELADQLLVTKANITQLIKKLEQMDLIKKEKEWKTNYISLTEKGETIYREANSVLEDFQKDFFKNLSIEEKKKLLHLLRKVEK
ncbi:MarR family transcriptional regulator [Aeribacillus sp. FSL K6-8394]|uniref:MarR family winged helix-turn-helix transcriptional regulator n=1 Tax=Aeribacillus sp. FSL K6-8394 TaxID=2954570 RepID=UPI0030FD1117